MYDLINIFKDISEIDAVFKIESISENEFFSIKHLELMSITEMMLRLEDGHLEMQSLKEGLRKLLDTIEFLEYLDLGFEEKKAYQAEIMRHDIERLQVKDPLGEYLDDMQKVYGKDTK